MAVINNSTSAEITVNMNTLDNVGNTPLQKFEINRLTSIDLFVKLENYNPTGSIKDRPAYFIL